MELLTLIPVINDPDALLREYAGVDSHLR